MASGVDGHPDPIKCEKYARFASHMVRWQFKSIYWTMFAMNLFVLFIASWIFSKGQDTLDRFGRDSHKGIRTQRLFMALCIGAVNISLVIVVMEAFALMALEFCDGEDLMSLYWSSWMMTQVGSLIAIVGIVLAMVHSLWNRKHPPWALALGTPVLVIAGIMNLMHDCTSRRISKFRSRSKDEDNEDGPPISQVNTISAAQETDADVKGECIGFSTGSGPIVRFTQSISIPENAELLGYFNNDQPIVMYPKDAVRFITAGEENAKPGTSRTDRTAVKEKETV